MPVSLQRAFKLEAKHRFFNFFFPCCTFSFNAYKHWSDISGNQKFISQAQDLGIGGLRTSTKATCVSTAVLVNMRVCVYIYIKQL